MIVRLGTWHAYHELGWIGNEEMRHNPFLRSDSYEAVLLRDVDIDIGDPLELFFYF